jgi:hypothetical protein
VYAWYFDVVPPGVPTERRHTTDAGALLYVGIAPKQPPANGRPASRQSLRTRVRYHYRGNAAGSTLRLTLGASYPTNWTSPSDALAAEPGSRLRLRGSSD